MLLLVAFVVGTPLLGSPVFVSAALQRGEFYAGLQRPVAEVPIAQSARQRALHVARAVHAQAHKASAKLSALNLFLHLSGLAESVRGAGLPMAASGAWRAVVPQLPAWDLVFAIFEPPRAGAVLR